MLDRRQRVTLRPYQQPGVVEAAGLTREQCQSAAWAYSPERQYFRGAAAVNAAVAVALATRLPLWLYALPGLHALQDWLYDWVVRHRRHFPGTTPYCEQHPEQCG